LNCPTPVREGDLILANGSVDQTGTYVFEVRPQGIGESIGRISGYWSVDNGNDAMFSIWNPTDAPQDITATLYYGDGSGQYHLPIHLAPQASTMLDVGMLIMEKTRDIDGLIIPSNIREGSASFDSAGHDSNAYDGKKRVTAVIAGGLFNTANATCGMVCTYCNGYSNFGLSPSSATIPVGGTQLFVAQATDSYGHLQNLSGGIWGTSDNGSIATVDGQGIVTGQGPGSTFVSDLLQNIIVFQGNYCVNENMPDNCPTGNPAPAASVTVTPAISQDKALWYFGQGVPTPTGFTLGATSATLTANGRTAGTFKWTITNGTSKMTLENGSSTITKTNSNTVGINSTSFSTATNDVTVQLLYTPSGGSQMPAFNLSLTIDSPYKLVSNGSPVNKGISAAGTCDANYTPGTDGYLSAIPYTIKSFTGLTITNAPVNEFLGSPSNPTTNDWPANVAESFTAKPGTFSDYLCNAGQNGALSPQPLVPQNPLTSTLIRYMPQVWSVGDLTTGFGVEVQSDTLNLFIDHGTHNPITSPVR
jgi:hypothetical protein